MSDTDIDPAGATVDVETPPRAPIEWRRAGGFDVHFAERVIELLAVPWDTDAVVEYPPGSGRGVIESVAPGAFDGVERRANRVKVNRDHNPERTVGRATALHPSRVDGLVAELRIARTDLGDETLALADDRALEASVGMAVAPSWQHWSEGRSRRRVHKAFLEHIAMLPEGAYGSPHQILDVRGGLSPAGYGTSSVAAVVATPNIDAVAAWLYEQRQR